MGPTSGSTSTSRPVTIEAVIAAAAAGPITGRNEHPQEKDEVESPSTSNGTALARFEFEAGRGNDGTKILMVEWEDDESTGAVHGDWHISWEGKSTVLPVSDDNRPLQNQSRSAPSQRLFGAAHGATHGATHGGSDASSTSPVHRLYFLLPPGVPVPPVVTLTYRASDRTTITTWRANSLPAIFPPSLGATARTAGRKGVLHTLWAKKRLQALQAEIEAESRINAESVGLLMALQERDWIESNFGIVAKPGAEGTLPPVSPSSPRSPGGGRLMEKLKGLKLGTSERDLSGRTQEAGDGATVAASIHQQAANPLSPDSSDVAVSSFSVFKGTNPAALATRALPRQQPAAPKTMEQLPSPFGRIAHHQQQGQERMQSLVSVSVQPLVSNPTHPATQVSEGETEAKEEKDDLFALPISPRSPEMTKSPFSFTSGDTLHRVRGEKVL